MTKDGHVNPPPAGGQPSPRFVFKFGATPETSNEEEAAKSSEPDDAVADLDGKFKCADLTGGKQEGARTEEDSEECSDDIGDDDEYYDDEYYDDEYDSDDSDFPPRFVCQEIDRRMEMKEDAREKLGPASDEVVEALREHYEAGKAFCDMGYIDCLEYLGVDPSAKDELVIGPEYNCFRITFVKNDESEEDSDDEVDTKMQRDHVRRVHLIRYRNFIDHMSKTQGVAAELEWHMANCDGLSYNGDDTFFDVNDVLSDDQLLCLIKGFSSDWYWYIMSDNILSGVGANIKAGKNVDEGLRVQSELLPGGMRQIQMDLSENTLYEHSREIQDRYETLRCPLGPRFALNPHEYEPTTAQPKPKKKRSGKKGKKNRGRRGSSQPAQDVEPPASKGVSWKPHPVEIGTRLTTLLSSMDASLRPTNASASIVVDLSDMLRAAARHDPAVANALVDADGFRCGSMAIRLADKLHAYAKQTGDRQWWSARSGIMSVLGISVRSQLHRRDELATSEEFVDDNIDLPATSFFAETMVPWLLPHFVSHLAEERAPAISTFEKGALHLARTVLFKLIKKKSVWTLIEDSAALSLEQCELNSEDAAVSTFTNYMKHCALDEIASFLYCLSARGKKVEKYTAIVSPTELGTKLVKRGIVPLMMNIAKADLGRPSFRAMEGLSDASRVKDCRQLMLQDPDCLEFLSATLSSSDGSMVSPTLLLVLHLLWDVEWCVKLSDFEPSLEKISMRWALYAMDAIIEREASSKRKKNLVKMNFMSTKAKSLCAEDEEEKEILELRAKELELELKTHNVEHETDDMRTNLDSLLGRCVLIMSAVYKLDRGSEKIMSIGGLSLFALALEVKIGDTRRAACGGIMNALNSFGVENLPPSKFFDPYGFVLACAEIVLDIINHNKSPMEDQMNALILQITTSFYSRRSWKLDCFDKLPPQLAEFMKTFCCGLGIAPRATHRSEPTEVMMRRQMLAGNDNLNKSCTTFTGKLKMCSNCGKLEGRNGEFSSCSKCLNCVYCSRECQVLHWPVHKIECKKLRK